MTRDGSLPLLCLALALQGCIFAEPPKQDPRQTPVVFDLSAATPLTTKLVQFETQDIPREFTVPFLSEDAGEDVWWAVHRNFNVGGDADADNGPFVEDASTLTDTSRKIRFAVQPLNADPCFQLTLMACHYSSFDLSQQQCRGDAHEDTAMAVWWVTVGDTQIATLNDCPQPQPSTP